MNPTGTGSRQAGSEALRKKARALVEAMNADQIEQYCSRGSVWWRSNSEYELRIEQEHRATERLYQELLAAGRQS